MLRQGVPSARAIGRGAFAVALAPARDDQPVLQPREPAQDPCRADHEPDHQPCRGIDALPPKQQTAIILYYLHGYSLAEAAEIADCNVGTMKSRLHYALKALRVRLPVERRVPVGTTIAARVTTR